MATIPFVVVVHPSVPAATLQEFINLARARAGKLNYASGGTGTTSHLAGRDVQEHGEVDVVHVPYKGVGPAVTDLLGGPGADDVRDHAGRHAAREAPAS
jgi:tripartite-type tricarboxylate transporter receptor subunit TctC